MLVKRDDGLGPMLLPYVLPGLAAAVLLTLGCGVRGLLAVPVFLGLWLLGTLAVILAVVLYWWILSLTVDMKAPPPKEAHPFYRFHVLWVISFLARVSRVRLHYTGDEKLPEGRFVLVSNHRSAFDPILTVWALRKRTFSIITKPENLRRFIAGPLIYRANFLPIDREDPRQAMRTIQAATELITDDVVSVGVYPEGTRNRRPEEGLLPFHNGVFKIAQRAGVPLVVASVRGTEDIARHAPWKPTEVYLNICEVIPPEELAGSTGTLGKRVREILEEDLQACGRNKSCLLT